MGAHPGPQCLPVLRMLWAAWLLSENIWVCSRSDFPRRLEGQVREQGKDGGQVRQRRERVKPRGAEGFALRRRPSSSSPGPAWGGDSSESSALSVSFLVPGRLPLGPALR